MIADSIGSASVLFADVVDLTPMSAGMFPPDLPVPRADHADAVAEFALRLHDQVATNGFEGRWIRLRIGISSGPLVAGVIGIHGFAYDLWGDVVNRVSRMESGVPGSMQISGSTFSLIGDRFVCERRGLISVKGKGDDGGVHPRLETFQVVAGAGIRGDRAQL
jgi:class 3 adenylate cyclase